MYSLGTWTLRASQGVHDVDAVNKPPDAVANPCASKASTLRRSEQSILHNI